MDKREYEKKVLQELPCPEDDALIKPGVLLSDEIKRFVDQFKLIDPFYPENLKAAGYELTVGDEYAIGGKIGKLCDEPGQREVTIQPFEVLIIKTRERVNMPRFLIARWNIRVKWAYEGLLWVGGPQVDPGYVGHLYCPIYNLSNKDVTLRLGEAIALIDFVTTTPFKTDQSKPYQSKPYQRPPTRVLFDDYHPDTLKSALYTEARKRIEEVENKVNSVETRLNTSLGITFTILAIIIATLSMLVALSKGPEIALPWMLYINTAISIIALTLAILAISVRYLHPSKELKLDERIRRLNRISLFLTVGIIAAAIGIWLIAEKICW